MVDISRPTHTDTMRRIFVMAALYRGGEGEKFMGSTRDVTLFQFFFPRFGFASCGAYGPDSIWSYGVFHLERAKVRWHAVMTRDEAKAQNRAAGAERATNPSVEFSLWEREKI